MTNVPNKQPKGRANRRHRKAPIRINAFGVRGLDTTVVALKEYACADLGDEAALLNHKDVLRGGPSRSEDPEAHPNAAHSARDTSLVECDADRCERDRILESFKNV
jgi:hypothetical protein